MTDSVPNKPVDVGPLDWRVSITDKSGRPSPEFQRRWNTNRNNTTLIGTITFGSGPPTSTPQQDGAEYADISSDPIAIYVAQNGTWHTTQPVSHSPTATASDVVVAGTAKTFMRSDAAPAVQKATTSQFGLVKPDGSTINITSGVISVPVATTSLLGLVKPDGSTIHITSGVISVPIGTTSTPGLLQPDGTTILVSGGVISAAGGGGGGSPTLAGVVFTTDGSGGSITIKHSKNVASVTRSATGFYTITFTSALSDTFYGVLGMSRPADFANNDVGLVSIDRSPGKGLHTGSVDLCLVSEGSFSFDPVWCYVVCMDPTA